MGLSLAEGRKQGRAGELVQKGSEQQVITSTFVSALPELDNRSR